MKYFTIAILAFSLNAFAQTPNDGLAEMLVANPYAQPDNICSGQPVQLFAIPGGGSSEYSYTWTSDPAGFTSNLQNPIVTPRITTNYKVDVNDGISVSTGYVTVEVKPLPTVNLMPIDESEIRIISENEIGVCAFDSVTLDAGNPGSHYLWSNGSTNQTVTAQTSGITYDMQVFNVTVTDPTSGCSDNATISVYFTFSDCSYGIEEKLLANQAVFYPNPSNSGIFNYTFNQIKGNIILEIFTAQGILIKKHFIPDNRSNTYQSTLNLSNQTDGIYFLRATHNNGVIQQKLIIQ
ncbi:MAG: T9SS type A sorting domain-containing protein [Omnitrophica WOR_2 bacterium]